MTSFAPHFTPGARIRVKADYPETRGPCHIRTPHYLRGREGVVERPLGAFRNPEDLAFARPAATIPLYHVRFDQQGLWNDGPAAAPAPGEPGDTVLVELYEHWLEPAV